MKNNETGRSMVEMLGVLAIIGVLSVGGIAGYTMAMRKYKANEVLNTASMLSMLAKSANGGVGNDLTTTQAGLTVPVSGITMSAYANGEVTISGDAWADINDVVCSSTSGDLVITDCPTTP